MDGCHKRAPLSVRHQTRSYFLQVFLFNATKGNVNVKKVKPFLTKKKNNFWVRFYTRYLKKKDNFKYWNINCCVHKPTHYQLNL